LGWIAVVAFIALLWLDARTTLITLWGIIGAGLVVSMILTEHGETIQRSAWLRRNAGIVDEFVVSIIASTGFAQLLAVGVSPETANQLRFGETHAARSAAAVRSREVIRRFRESAPLPIHEVVATATGLSRSHQMVSRLVAANSSLMDRMTELHGALQQWETMIIMTAGTLPDRDAANTEVLLGIRGIRDQDDEAARTQRRALFSNLAAATVDVCERCSDLQEEAGTIPSG
jgi:hypothetical protein